MIENESPKTLDLKDQADQMLARMFERAEFMRDNPDRIPLPTDQETNEKGVLGCYKDYPASMVFFQMKDHLYLPYLKGLKERFPQGWENKSAQSINDHEANHMGMYLEIASTNEIPFKDDASGRPFTKAIVFYRREDGSVSFSPRFIYFQNGLSDEDIIAIASAPIDPSADDLQVIYERKQKKFKNAA